MRLWLEYLTLGGLLWAASLQGVHPALRLMVGGAVLVWGAVAAARPSRVR